MQPSHAKTHRDTHTPAVPDSSSENYPSVYLSLSVSLSFSLYPNHSYKIWPKVCGHPCLSFMDWDKLPSSSEWKPSYSGIQQCIRQQCAFSLAFGPGLFQHDDDHDFAQSPLHTQIKGFSSSLWMIDPYISLISTPSNTFGTCGTDFITQHQS